MGTTIRPELSTRNRYWIDKHRYYELKHFCLQYKLWKKAYANLEGLKERPLFDVSVRNEGEISDPTARCAESRIFYADRIEMVERVAEEASPEFKDYILMAVTEGLSYEHIRVRTNIPCCKDIYYSIYRRFFWLLSRERG